MRASVPVLMKEIIDYAGLFPPARLDMPDAFDRYRIHRSGAHGWMLSRFVCPAQRLSELRPLLGRLDRDDDPIHISVLGRGGDSTEGFLSAITTDVDDMERLRAEYDDQVVMDQFETRLPNPVDELSATLTVAMHRLNSWSSELAPFFETSLLNGWRERLSDVADAVARAGSPGHPVGLKIRCGGLDASAVPSPVAVALAVSACRRHRIPLKATQGLHHPVRHFDSAMETTVHGFFNLFVAGVLAWNHRLTEDQLLAVVEEESAAAFRFADDGLVWRDWGVDLKQIASARTDGVTSFGSCSFSEPSDDLRRLGLFDQEPPQPGD